MQPATQKKCLVLGGLAVTAAVVLVLCVVFLPKGGNPVTQRATCELVGSIQGTLIVEEHVNDLQIEGRLTGVPLGRHAIHVHQFGKTGNSCVDAGAHYNPTNVNHGGPSDNERHVGDWGNFDVAGDPYLLKIMDHVAKLQGPSSILDRSIVIHAGEDDLGQGGNDASKQNGNAGARLACCVITAV